MVRMSSAAALPPNRAVFEILDLVEAELRSTSMASVRRA